MDASGARRKNIQTIAVTATLSIIATWTVATAAHHGDASRPAAGARAVPATLHVAPFRGGKGAAGDPVPGDDYPAQWRAPVPQDSVFDTWGMYNRECTSWVAWALHSRNHFDIPFYDDATEWGRRAAALGFRVDSTPAVGAVGWAPRGHVVWVYAFDGGTVTIQEYNAHYDGTYSWRTVPATAFQYIHFLDIANPTAPVTALAPPLQGNTTPVQGSTSQVQPAAPVVQGSTQHVQGTHAGGGGQPSTPPTPPPTSPPPTQPAPPQPPPPTYYAETTGGEAHTWTNYTNAGGQEGPTIESHATVQIACRIQGFKVADGNTWWYRIAQSPWSNNYYVSADAFYNNGATSGSLSGTPYVDEKVPTC